MNNETLQLLIQPRTDVNECINANVHTISLRLRENNSMYQCDIALPCTDITVCNLLEEFMQLPMSTMSYPLTRVASNDEYHNWIDEMQSALASMRTKENLAKDLVELAIPYKHNNLQLVKFLKNKYQFGLKETKELVDLYYLTL